MELTLLIQGIAHAQVRLFLMCFRSKASTRVLVKLSSTRVTNYSVSAALYSYGILEFNVPLDTV